MHGRVIAHFQLERELGRGGMGVVWLARDTMLERHVALKLIQPSEGSGLARERFLREARAAARLMHSSVVAIHECGEDLGELYIAMEYIDGPTLADVIAREGPLSLERLLRLGRAMLDALAAAHGIGILHRDIKPANILIGPGFTPKLADFGLARWSEPSGDPGDGGLTSSGVVVGTPAYLAPEQLAGRRGDERTDLFTLGVVLYEAATGRHPFRDGNRGPALFGRRVPAPHALRPELPPALSAALLEAIAIEPERRFASAREFRSAYIAALGPAASDPAAATRTSGLPLSPAARTRPRGLFLGLAALLLVLTAALLLSRSPSVSPERGAVPTPDQEELPKLVLAASPGPEAERRFGEFVASSATWPYLRRHFALLQLGASSEMPARLPDWIRVVQRPGTSFRFRDFVARHALESGVTGPQRTWAIAQYRSYLQRLLQARKFTRAAEALELVLPLEVGPEPARLLYHHLDRFESEVASSRNLDAFLAMKATCEQLTAIDTDAVDRCKDLEKNPLAERERKLRALFDAVGGDRRQTQAEYAWRLVEALSPGDASRSRDAGLCIQMLARLERFPCRGAWEPEAPLELEDLVCLAGIDATEIPSQEYMRGLVGDAGVLWAEANVREEWGDHDNARQLLDAARLLDPHAGFEPAPPPRQTAPAPLAK